MKIEKLKASMFEETSPVIMKINELIDAFNTIETRAVETMGQYKEMQEFIKKELKKISDFEKEPKCIFCGNEITEFRNNGQFKYIYCGRCCASGPYENTKQGALQSWNKSS